MNRMTKWLSMVVIVVMVGLTLTGQKRIALKPQMTMRGLVQPGFLVTLNAPVDGVLKKVEVEEGQRLKEGQVLAVMDDRLQQLVVELATLAADSQSSVKQGVLRRDEMKIVLERMTRAFEKDAASEWEVRRAKLQWQLAEAELVTAKEQQQQARSKLKLEQHRLKQHTLTAPKAGVVIQVMAEIGQNMRTNDGLLLMVNLDTLEARINLPVALYYQLKMGQVYQLEAGAPVSRVISGRLKSADPVIDPASQTFRCIFEIDNKKEQLPAGFIVNLIWDKQVTAGTESDK